MGNTSSSVTPVLTVPLQKTPVPDGASGLHFGGHIYTNPSEKLATDICNGATVSPAQIGDIMPKSISSTTLPVDDSTHRIQASALQSYVSQLTQTGAIPGTMQTFDEQMKADTTFYTAVNAEYCFYETRYVVALTEFLGLVSNPTSDPSTTTAALNAVVGLNKRLNSLIEILNAVTNERAQQVQTRGPKLDAANATLNKRLAALTAQQKFFTSSDVRLRTQEEMMRFSAEKNHAMNIQIGFFVALNVVAIGAVLTVYRSTK
jgi:hypothetical protein